MPFNKSINCRLVKYLYKNDIQPYPDKKIPCFIPLFHFQNSLSQIDSININQLTQ